jgi:glutaredoxin
MEIKIYTSAGCVHCTHVKVLLERANLTWEEIEIGKDITMENFKSKYPTVDYTPFVIIDGNYYIGLVEVARKFLKEGLVEAPKKSEN